MNTETMQDATDAKTETVQAETTTEQTGQQAEEATAREAKENGQTEEITETAAEQKPTETDEQKQKNREAYERRQERKRLRELEIENVRLAERARVLEELGINGGKAKDTAEQLVRPKRDEFQTDEEYESAQETYITRKVRADLKAERDRESLESTTRAEAARFQESRDNFISRGVQKFGEDFQEDIMSKSLKVSVSMRDAMMESEIGPDIGKHLIDNPEVAAQIYTLSPVKQVKAMLDLEGKIKALATKPTTKAPAPITTVRAAATADKEPENDDEWKRQRDEKRRAALLAGRK